MVIGTVEKIKEDWELREWVYFIYGVESRPN